MRKRHWLNEEVTAEPHIELTPKRTVETIDNHVYFYAMVDSDRCLALINEISAVDRFLRGEHLSRSLPANHPGTPIWLHINSPGGHIFDALAVADILQETPTPVYSIVEGYAASAATLISMACQRRFITRSSYMMIHQVSSFAWGTFEQIEDETKLLAMLMDTLTKFYQKHSALGSDEEVGELLRRDSWFSAEQCVDRGLADSIWERSG